MIAIFGGMFSMILIGIGLLASAIGSFLIYQKVDGQSYRDNAYVPQHEKARRETVIAVTHTYSIVVAGLGLSLIIGNLINTIAAYVVVKLVRATRS